MAATSIPYINHGFATDFELGDSFLQTKTAAFKQYDSIANSMDYKYENPDSAKATVITKEKGHSISTEGKGMDGLAKHFALKTPILILKGFVNLTDPAVGTAMNIIEGAYQVVMAGINVAKQVAQQAVDTARSNLAAAEDILNQLKAQKAQLVASADPALEPFLETKLSEVDSPPPWPDTFPEDLKEKVESLPPDMKPVFEQVADVEKAIADQQKVVDEMNEAVTTAETEFKEIVEGAEQTMKDIKASPWTLPVTTLAMLPSAVPFGVGFPPPPVGPGIGPPLTGPGLVYLGLQFLDDHEKAIEKEIENAKEDCDLGSEPKRYSSPINS